MRSALAVAVPDREFSFDLLDAITCRRDDKATLLPQLARGLSIVGVRWRYFVRPGFLELLDRDGVEERARGIYGWRIGTMFPRIDFEALCACASQVAPLPELVVASAKPSLDHLRRMIHVGAVPICLLDYAVLAGRCGTISGHYVTVTGIDNRTVTFHDSGPKQPTPHRRVSRSAFESAWRVSFFDHDTIVVEQ
jgi:hypothetical protein